MALTAARAIRCVGLLSALATAAPAAAQRAIASRFPIDSVGDSTFVFAVRDSRWVERGLRGDAVDPRKRDSVVARFRVLAVARGRATALITGQTTDVTAAHVALLVRTPAPWYRRPSLWAGVLVGAAAGALIGRANP
ncbi:MAG: hypothetical protein WKG32_02165 [Gemmatimonadaceae bacterium]